MFQVVCGECERRIGETALVQHARNLAEWHGEMSGHYGRIVYARAQDEMIYTLYAWGTLRSYRRNERRAQRVAHGFSTAIERTDKQRRRENIRSLQSTITHGTAA